MKARLILFVCLSLSIISSNLANQKATANLFEEAVALQEKGNHIQALELFERLKASCEQEQASPACSEMFQYWSISLMANGRFEAADSILQEGEDYCRERAEQCGIASYLAARSEFARMTGDKERHLRLARAATQYMDCPATYGMHTHLASAFTQEGKPDSARMYFEKALTLARNHQDSSKLTFVLSEMALWERSYGSRRRAIDLLLECLRQLNPEEPKHKAQIVVAYHRIAYLFFDLVDDEKALEYLEKALEMSQREGLKRLEAWSKLHMSEAYRNLGEIEIAEDYNRQAIEIFEEENMYSGIEFAYVFKANQLIKRDELKEAAFYLDKARLIAGDAKKVSFSMNYHICRSRYFIATGDKKAALAELILAKSVSPRMEGESHVRFSVDERIAKLYEELGDYENALTYFQIAGRSRDSLLRLDQLDILYELEAKYESERKDLQLLEEQLKLERKTKEMNRALLGGGALLIISLGAFVFYRNRMRYRHHIAEQEVIALENKNRLLAFTSMIEGQETERIRVAKDLHDGVGGLLTTVKSHFQAIPQEVRQLEHSGLYQKTMSLIDTACTEVRRVSHNMAPHSLTLLGLDGALEDLKDQLNIDSKLDCKLEIWGDLSELPKNKSVMVYRIIQELSNNVMKHAEADTLLLQLFETDSSWNITVEDNGKGFNLSESKMFNSSIGLKSVESRVKYLNGTINYDSEPGLGTSVNIEFPKYG